MIRGLNRYHIQLAALQETNNWFGNNVYRVGKCVVLTAGRQVPGPEQTKQRGEGVVMEGIRRTVEGVELKVNYSKTEDYNIYKKKRIHSTPYFALLYIRLRLHPRERRKSSSMLTFNWPCLRFQPMNPASFWATSMHW